LFIGKDLLSLFRVDHRIELDHLLRRLSDVLGPGADPRLDLFGLGHNVNQIFFLFLERKTARLAGEARDNDGTIRRRAFPLFQYLESHTMTASPSQADTIQKRHADLGDPTSKRRRRSLQSLGGCCRCGASARPRVFRSHDPESDDAH